MGIFDPNIFDSNIFDTGAAAPAPSSGGTVLSGASFSRKRWRELKAAIEAAEDKQEQVKAKAAKEALAVAVAAAEVVAAEAPSDDGIGKLISLLEAAAEASKTAAIISKANAAASAARALMDEIDDEEAILWLM